MHESGDYEPNCWRPRVRIWEFRVECLRGFWDVVRVFVAEGLSLACRDSGVGRIEGCRVLKLGSWGHTSMRHLAR